MNFLTTALNGVRAALFGYDSIEDKGRRKRPAADTRNEDKELTQSQRRQLVSTGRDIQRNFSIAAWAIRKHLDYVSSFTFQARTGDDALDDEVDAMVAEWARKENCDPAGRHSLRRKIRMWEERRTVDGDLLLNLLDDGRIQEIEGDRIRNPDTVPQPFRFKLEDFVHGVITDANGKALAYAVCDRPKNSINTLVFRGLIPASFAIPLGYYTRFDQVRGVSLLSPAINTFRDVYEGFDYALAKAKVAQLFALAIYRENSDELGEATATTTDEDGNEVDPRYKIDFNRGPTLLDLDPGDRAEVLAADTPGTDFQAFTVEMISVALKALDIPVSFYDEGRANFSSGRQAWILYNQSATNKREDLREVLDQITAWRLRMFIRDGDLKLPKGFDPKQLQWDWIHAGIPWIDPLKEVSANVMELNAGLNSRQRIMRSRGGDFYKVIDELAAEKKYAESKGILLPETPFTVTVNTADGQQQQDNANAN